MEENLLHRPYGCKMQTEMYKWCIQEVLSSR